MLYYRHELVAELPSQDLILLDLFEHYVTESSKDPVAVLDTVDAVDIREFSEVKEYCCILLQLFIALHGIKPFDAGVLICKSGPDFGLGRPDDLLLLVDDVFEEHHKNRKAHADVHERSAEEAELDYLACQREHEI